jgi:uncharacterized protein (DUF302 family)
MSHPRDIEEHPHQPPLLRQQAPLGPAVDPGTCRDDAPPGLSLLQIFRSRQISLKTWMVPLLCLFSLALQPLRADESPIVVTQVEGEYAEVLDSVKAAIKGKGINIAHTLGAAEMLNRTGVDFGISNNVYLHAEIVEFCSASISHKLSQKNSANITVCPFAISVYVTADDPQHVKLAYRRPTAGEESAQEIGEVVKLLESIIAEASEW